MAIEAPIAPAAVHVTVARTEDEVERLRDVWEAGGIDADLDYFMTVVRERDEVVRPHIVHVARPGRPDGLVVARLEHAPLDARLGYLTVARPRVRSLHVVRGGLIGADGVHDALALLAPLGDALRTGEADVLVLAGLKVDGDLHRAATRAVPRWRRDAVPVPAVRWTADVPDSLPAFLAARSKNTRDNVKRYGKKFEKAYADRFEVRAFRDETDLEPLCADIERVAALTYQRGLGVGFTGDRMQRELMRLGMRRGWYRAWVLYIDGVPVAFWDGQAYAGSFGIGSPGFDPEFSNQRIGQWLQMRMMEDLCASDDVTRIDYGTGDAQYKRSFGDHQVGEEDVLLFAPRPRALAVNLIRGAVGGATRLAQRVLGDSDFARNLKRRWRERAAS